MKILFLHGWHSVPGGVKPTYLREHGHTVINPALDDDDFSAALAVAQREFDTHQPQVVVGSSRGGALAMNLQSGNAKLVLLCPAWRKYGSAKTVKRGTTILHSQDDDVIAYADSEALIAQSGLPESALLEVGCDHRLADPDSLAAMLWVCEQAGSVDSSEFEKDASEEPLLEGKGPHGTTQDVGSYVCDACGEKIVIPIDLTEGSTQTYTEDCPVCCRASVIHVSVDEAGNAQVRAEPEQDESWPDRG